MTASGTWRNAAGNAPNINTERHSQRPSIIHANWRSDFLNEERNSSLRITAYSRDDYRVRRSTVLAFTAVSVVGSPGGSHASRSRVAFKTDSSLRTHGIANKTKQEA